MIDVDTCEGSGRWRKMVMFDVGRGTRQLAAR